MSAMGRFSAKFTNLRKKKITNGATGNAEWNDYERARLFRSKILPTVVIKIIHFYRIRPVPRIEFLLCSDHKNEEL